MSDNADSQRRRDRHRRHKNRDERQLPKNTAQTSRSSAQSSRNSAQSQSGGTGQKNSGKSSARDRERLEAAPMLPKLPTPLCARCGEPIQDITSAMNDRDSGAPVHFDCVLKFLQGAEELAQNERIVYIGQGRFAVMYFENPVDTRKFKIIRTIEWEKREQKENWRTDISGRFSQIK